MQVYTIFNIIRFITQVIFPIICNAYVSLALMQDTEQVH